MPAPLQLSKISTWPLGREVTIKPYLVGVVLALVLTMIPFGIVAAGTLRPIQIFVVISVAAITQVVVHLRYFLHLDLKPSSQNKRIALCFAAVVLLILVGGTLWMMFDLSYPTMRGGAATVMRQDLIRSQPAHQGAKSHRPFDAATTFLYAKRAFYEVK
jgi:cytochrome o ubiquinol oxidase subunit IV